MRGWFNQSYRHSLASRGISTSRYFAKRIKPRRFGRVPTGEKPPSRILRTPGGDPEEALRRFALGDLPKSEQERVASLRDELSSIQIKQDAGEATAVDRARKSEIQEEIRVATGVGPRKFTPTPALTNLQILESVPQSKLLSEFSVQEQGSILDRAQALPPKERKAFIIGNLPEDRKVALIKTQRLRGLPEIKKPAETLVQNVSISKTPEGVDVKEVRKPLVERLERLRSKQERAQAVLSPQPSDIKSVPKPMARSPLEREPVEEALLRQDELEAKRLASLERAREAKAARGARDGD